MAVDHVILQASVRLTTFFINKQIKIKVSTENQ